VPRMVNRGKLRCSSAAPSFQSQDHVDEAPTAADVKLLDRVVVDLQPPLRRSGERSQSGGETCAKRGTLGVTEGDSLSKGFPRPVIRRLG
jgi:hypothetical protein